MELKYKIQEFKELKLKKQQTKLTIREGKRYSKLKKDLRGYELPTQKTNDRIKKLFAKAIYIKLNSITTKTEELIKLLENK